MVWALDGSHHEVAKHGHYKHLNLTGASQGTKEYLILGLYRDYIPMFPSNHQQVTVIAIEFVLKEVCHNATDAVGCHPDRNSFGTDPTTCFIAKAYSRS